MSMSLSRPLHHPRLQSAGRVFRFAQPDWGPPVRLLIYVV